MNIITGPVRMVQNSRMQGRQRGRVVNAKSVHSGTSLTEVLVALIITAIGLLSLLSLHSIGLRATQNAYYRTQAVLMAEDLAERVKANRLGFSGLRLEAAGTAEVCGCAYPRACQTALQDIQQWQDDLSLLLPSGRGALCAAGSAAVAGCNAAPGFSSVQLWWDSNRDGNPEQELTLVFRP